MQRREQPGLDLGQVAELVSFCRPDAERLLGEILRVRFNPCETHREPEQRLVVLAHDRFELIC